MSAETDTSEFLYSNCSFPFTSHGNEMCNQQHESTSHGCDPTTNDSTSGASDENLPGDIDNEG